MSHASRPRAIWILRALAATLARLTGLEDLPADLDDLYESRWHRYGAARAHLWYVTQLGRSPLGLMRHQRGRSRARAEHSTMQAAFAECRSAGVRVARSWRHLALPFVAIVGLGVTVSTAMVQIRQAMLHPDLGVATEVLQASWDTDTRQRQTSLDVTGRESWAIDPPDGVAGLLAIGPYGTALIESPGGWTTQSVHSVPAGFLTTLGVRPQAGRDLAEPLDVLLSDAFWRRHWPEGSGIGDEVVTTRDGRRGRVVGIAPRTFDGPVCCVRPAAWIVDAVEADATRAASLYVAGPRSRRDAEAAVRIALAGQFETVAQVTLVNGRDGTDLDPVLRVLVGLAILAFLGTVLNSGNLLLSGITDRHRELRMRRALGASRRRLALSVIFEVGWLAAAVAVVGAIGAALFMRTAPGWIPMLNTPDSVVDLPVGWPAIVTVAVSAALVTVLCGVPAVFASLAAIRGNLLVKGGGPGPRDRLVSAALLTVQVALATTLAAVTFLHRDALAALDGDFVGFRHGQTAVFFVNAAPAGSGVLGVSPAIMLAGLTDRPDVEAAAVSRWLPVYGASRSQVEILDHTVELAVEMASVGYLDALGLRLLAGSLPAGPDEALLSADTALGIADVPSSLIGATAGLGDERVRIVGIAESATWGTGGWRRTMYRGWVPATIDSAVLVVRPSAGARSVSAETIREDMRGAGLAARPFGTLASLLVRSRVMGEFLARSATVFSLLCLVVALGGVLAHFRRWVRQRSRDFGIRVCLGATSRQARRDVFRAAAVPLGAGLMLGGGAAWMATRVMVAFMPEAPTGLLLPIANALVVVLTLSLAMVLLPAAAAGRTNPASVLRAD